MYQICASYERLTTPPTTGFWHCQNVPLFDEGGQLSFTRSDEVFVEPPQQVLPKPVNCQKANCQCLQSTEDHNLVLIRWKSTAELSYKSNPASSYTVHYTLNETDPDAGEEIAKRLVVCLDGAK